LGRKNLRDPNTISNEIAEDEWYLDGDVSVSNDEAIAVELGWRTVVCLICVGEMSQFHTSSGDLNLEGCVRSNVLVVLREQDQRRRHISLGRDEALIVRRQSRQREIPMEYRCKNH